MSKMRTPKIVIPDIFMEVPIEGAMERVLAKKPNEEQEGPTSKPFEFKAPDIVKHDYIQIPEINKVISRFELLGYNNLNWQDTHFKLHENGLYMPEVPDFMKPFVNVINSYNSKGKAPLFDAAGNPISREKLLIILSQKHFA